MLKTNPLVDEYNAGFPPQLVKILDEVREIIRSALPDEAEEVISYGMPTYKYHGGLICYAGAKNHFGIYPMNSTFVAEHPDLVKDYGTSPGAIRFPYEKGVPKALLLKITKIRMEENLARKSHRRKVK